MLYTFGYIEYDNRSFCRELYLKRSFFRYVYESLTLEFYLNWDPRVPRSIGRAVITARSRHWYCSKTCNIVCHEMSGAARQLWQPTGNASINPWTFWQFSRQELQYLSGWTTARCFHSTASIQRARFWMVCLGRSDWGVSRSSWKIEQIFLWHRDWRCLVPRH